MDCLESTFSSPVYLLNICPICGSTIERVPVQNRGTCFCPGCHPSLKSVLVFLEYSLEEDFEA
jgi:hypothetical protein